MLPPIGSPGAITFEEYLNLPEPSTTPRTVPLYTSDENRTLFEHRKSWPRNTSWHSGMTGERPRASTTCIAARSRFLISMQPTQKSRAWTPVSWSRRPQSSRRHRAAMRTAGRSGKLTGQTVSPSLLTVSGSAGSLSHPMTESPGRGGLRRRLLPTRIQAYRPTKLVRLVLPRVYQTRCVPTFVTRWGTSRHRNGPHGRIAGDRRRPPGRVIGFPA